MKTDCFLSNLSSTMKGYKNNKNETISRCILGLVPIKTAETLKYIR